jgi:hypothetical protein
MRVSLAARLIPVIALACACGSLPNNLQSEAAAVRIQKAAPSLEQFESLGEVFCEAGATFVRVASNMRACRNELRNEAYKLGASLIVVEIELLGVEGCENCISMFATAYKEKNDTDSEEYRTSDDWED